MPDPSDPDLIVALAFEKCRQLCAEFFGAFVPHAFSFEEGRAILWASIRKSLAELDANDPRRAESFAGLDARLFDAAIREFRPDDEIEFRLPPPEAAP